MKAIRLTTLVMAALIASGFTIPNSRAGTIANTIIVDPVAGSDTNGQRGTSNAYATLFKAVADSQAGDTIELRPGNHPIAQGGVTITTPRLTINGTGAHLVAAAGSIQSDARRLTVNADDLTINNLAVDGAPYGGAIPQQPAGDFGVVALSGKRAHLKDVSLSNGPGTGLYIQGDAQNCVIEGLVSTHFFVHIFVQEAANSDGKVVWPVGLKIRNPHLSGGYGRLAYSGGIKLKDYSQNPSDSRCEIIGADIESTGEMGIEAQSIPGSFSRIAIRGCKVYDTSFGISCASPEMLVEGCQIKGFSFIGIEAAGTAVRCNLQNNVLDGLLYNGSAPAADATGYSVSTFPGLAMPTDVLVQGGSVRDCGNMVKCFNIGTATFSGINFRPVSQSYAFSAQGTASLTFDHCHVEPPADGGTLLKVWFWQSDVTDPTLAPLLRIRDTIVDAIATQHIVAFYTLTNGAVTNFVAERVRCASTFCASNFVAPQGTITPISLSIVGCYPEAVSGGYLPYASQFGWVNNSLGTNLSLENGGYGGRFQGSVVNNVGGQMRLQLLDNHVATDALVVQHEPGTIRMRTEVPLSVDSTLSITGQSSAPATPASGVVVLWVNSTDGTLHAKDSNGVDHPLWGNRAATSQ